MSLNLNGVDMSKRVWFIPILIVAVNALAIIVRWSTLAEVLPAHFDLQGNASSTMQRSVLLLYPLVGAATILGAYLIARIKPGFQAGVVILSSGFCLVLLSSSLVTLTYGKVPLFMLDEPVILLATIIALVISILKSRKTSR